MILDKSRFVCVNIRNISQKTIHCIALWHIHILILPEINMNLLWYLKGTQLKTLRRENKSSETFTESGKKKASQTRCLTFAPYAWRRFTPRGVMRCGRELRTTHYIVLPRLTDYAAKICSFSLFARPVNLLNFRPLHFHMTVHKEKLSQWRLDIG